ncbi:MAG: hypothetical protein K2Y18_00615 [Alphaproteobacteria bacterium]|nr:hypothetical protein [Alphaproteobacteria bacterium]
MIVAHPKNLLDLSAVTFDHALYVVSSDPSGASLGIKTCGENDGGQEHLWVQIQALYGRCCCSVF